MAGVSVVVAVLVSGLALVSVVRAVAGGAPAEQARQRIVAMLWVVAALTVALVATGLYLLVVSGASEDGRLVAMTAIIPGYVTVRLRSMLARA